jgi:hypothetical protein
MRLNNTHNRTSAIPYCYPTVLPTKSLRLTFAETLPICCDLTFTLWKDWNGRTPLNEVVFAAWNSLDAVICHRFLRLGNGWRTSPRRPKWMVVLERQPNGNKHLHGIIECLPEIGRIKYAFAFRDGFHDCKNMRGFVPEIEETPKEIKWKTYITKYLEHEGRQDPFYLNRDPQREAYEFDFRLSPNFPCWKHTEL